MDKYPPNFIKVYVDLDNTITDFDQAVKDLTGKILEWDMPDEEKNKIYQAMDDAGPGFWSEMKWLDDTKGGRKLWSILEPFHPVLLSSPGQFLYAEQGKREWVASHVPGTTLFLVQSDDKYRYAERDAVLVDDDDDNIGAWREAGGIGILHKNTNDTEIKLLSLLAPKE